MPVWAGQNIYGGCITSNREGAAGRRAVIRSINLDIIGYVGPNVVKNKSNLVLLESLFFLSIPYHSFRGTIEALKSLKANLAI